MIEVVPPVIDAALLPPLPRGSPPAVAPEPLLPLRALDGVFASLHAMPNRTTAEKHKPHRMIAAAIVAFCAKNAARAQERNVSGTPLSSALEIALVSIGRGRLRSRNQSACRRLFPVSANAGQKLFNLESNKIDSLAQMSGTFE
jgi:hypothetical protein